MALFAGNEFRKFGFVFTPGIDYGEKCAQATENFLSYQGTKPFGNFRFEIASLFGNGDRQ